MGACDRKTSSIAGASLIASRFLVRLVGYSDLTDRINAGHPLANQYFDLPQFRDDFLGFVTLDCHVWSSLS